MANTITLLRFPLLVGLIVMFYLGNSTLRFIAIPVLLVLLMMDTLDGMIARRRGETSLLGSTLDIAADRAVEVVLWVCYSNLDLISVAIPVTVVIRGALTDTIRSVAVQGGVRPFDMMHSKWGRRLLGTPLMRTSYSVAKITAFTLLALTLALQTTQFTAATQWVWLVARIISWIALVMCVARGIPVLVDGWPMLSGLSQERESD